MRKNLLLTLMIMVISLGASAQFVGGTQTNTNSKQNISTNNDGWMSFKLSYNPMTLDAGGDLEDYLFDDDYDDLAKFRGFSGEILTGINVVKGMPVFIETGLGFLYTSSKYEDEDSGEEEFYNGYEYIYYEYSWREEYKMKFMSLYVPINLSYRLSLNDQISIMPYLGLKARFNISGTMDMYYEEELSGGISDYDDDEESFSWFDDGDMEEWFDDEIDPAKRFQLGWQIGMNVELNNFILGVNYGSDLGEILEDCKFKTTSLSIGYKF